MATENVDNVEPPSLPLAGNVEPTTEDTRSYRERLFTYAFKTSSDRPRFINFQRLHRINILNLQHELLKQHIATHQHSTTAEQDMEKWSSTLQQYTSAIRDYEYMLRLPSRGSDDEWPYLQQLEDMFPSIASSTKKYNNYNISTIEFPHESATNLPVDPLREWLKRILPRRLTYTQTEIERRLASYTYGEAPIEMSPFVDKLARFMVAITGGLSLVVPMLIMRLHENLNEESGHC